MVTRFILISPARSGSTMIRAAMTHPQILIHGEVMGTNQVRVVKAYMPENIRSLGEVELNSALLLARRRDTRNFFSNLIFNAAGKKKAVGFKLILDQALSMHFADALLWLSEQKDIKIIWLERRNQLARYASTLLVKKGRVLVNAKDETPDQLTTEVDPEEFQQDVRNQNAAMRIMREHLADNPGLDIVYEDFVNDPVGGYKQIFSFLGVDATVEPQLTTKKVNSMDLSDVISNLDSICSHEAISPYLTK